MPASRHARSAAFMVLFLGSMLVSCSEEPVSDVIGGEDWQAKRQARLAARGERLVDLIGCDSCHTPRVRGRLGPGPDPSRRLSGNPATARSHDDSTSAWAGLVAAPYDNTVILTPMGVRYASNLTPDVETGIGAWSSGLFVDRMRASEHWTVYSNDSALYSWSGYYSLTDQDLRSIYEYLRTLPAVVNPVPGSQPIGDWEW